MAKRKRTEPFKPSDPWNLPLQSARQRFMDHLGADQRVFRELADNPLTVWNRLSPEAQRLAFYEGWIAIDMSRHWADCPKEHLLQQTCWGSTFAVSLELIPLHDALLTFAQTFHLVLDGEPALWAMETVVFTLAQNRKDRVPIRWKHDTQMSEEYPADDPEYRPVSGVSNTGLYGMIIRIPPKQPHESFQRFATRFKKECRRAHEEYVRDLKAQGWETRPPIEEYKWIDRLALWQLGQSAVEIEPSITTSEARTEFTKRTRAVAHYLGVTRRVGRAGRRR